MATNGQQLARTTLYWLLGALLTVSIAMGASWTAHVEKGLEAAREASTGVQRRLERIEAKLEILIVKFGAEKQ